MEEDDIDFDENSISRECIDLMKELLDLSPTRRMSWNELKNHEWFIDIEIPIIKPEIIKEDDIFNIDDISNSISSASNLTDSKNKLSYTEQLELDDNVIIDN